MPVDVKAAPSAETLLTALLQTLVDTPSAVQVAAMDIGRTTVLSVRVAPREVGQIIGRNGNVKLALDVLARVWGGKHQRHYHIQIEDQRPPAGGPR